MKIALISDIHGNYEALRSVLNSIDKMQINEIFCLGDIVGYYSQVNECCDELRKRNVKCIIGNHDWYLVADSFCQRSRSVNDCLKYQRQVITQDNKSWLYSLPIIRKEYGISMVHGSWTNPIDDYLEPTEEYFNKIEGFYFASGHTHIQRLEKYTHKTYCNPGSVGQPRDNDNRAAFATFDGTKFALHRVSYDIDKVGTLMERAGFNGYYYGCLKIGAKNLCWSDK